MDRYGVPAFLNFGLWCTGTFYSVLGVVMNPPYTVLFHFSFCETWILVPVTMKLDGRTDVNIDVTVKSSQLAVVLLLTQVAFESPVVSHINN